MKILMVSRMPSHPQDAGNRQRVFRECEALRMMGHEVDFFYTENVLFGDEIAMREYFGNDHFYCMIPAEWNVKLKIKAYIRKWMNSRGISKKIVFKHNADEWCFDKIVEKVRELHMRKSYDVIWVHYIMHSKVLECIKDDTVLKVIDTHDRFSDRHKLFTKRNMVPQFFYTSKKEERRAMNRADVILAIQDKEREYFSKLLKYKKSVVTLGDMLEVVSCEFGDDFCYGFIGSVNAPNEEGIKWYCEKVLPLVQDKCPQSRFFVAGNICNVIPDYKGCIKLGRLNDLPQFYNQIRVAINPVRMGTGLNIKSIEALAYGKPLVTTTVGAKGINSDKDVYMCVDEAEAFAEAIVGLLNDKERCQLLQMNSRTYIEKYNQSNMQIIEKILNKKVVK